MYHNNAHSCKYNRYCHISVNSICLIIQKDCTTDQLKMQLNRSGADPGFQVGGRGTHLKKLRRAKGGAKNFGVFRVKNHDFTPKNHIFSNFRGGGAHQLRAPPLPPGSAPADCLCSQQ